MWSNQPTGIIKHYTRNVDDCVIDYKNCWREKRFVLHMMRRQGDNAGDAPEANWDNVKLFMLFWLLMVKEKLTWKKLAFSLQSGSCAQKSSWSEILGAPPEEYMVEGLTP